MDLPNGEKVSVDIVSRPPTDMPTLAAVNSDATEVPVTEENTEDPNSEQAEKESEKLVIGVGFRGSVVELVMIINQSTVVRFHSLLLQSIQSLVCICAYVHVCVYRCEFCVATDLFIHKW